MTVDLPFWSRALPRMGLVRFRMSASIVSKYVAHTQVPVSNLWSGTVLTRTSPEVEFSDAAVREVSQRVSAHGVDEDGDVNSQMTCVEWKANAGVDFHRQSMER